MFSKTLWFIKLVSSPWPENSLCLILSPLLYTFIAELLKILEFVIAEIDDM